MTNFGKDVDISARITGATKALTDLGLNKDVGKTRLGIDALKAPKGHAISQGPYTTSGTILNPKVS